MKKGFTLIELMIVVAIIAIIAAIAIPNLMESKKAANETQCIASMKAYLTAQETYRANNYSNSNGGGTKQYTADFQNLGGTDNPHLDSAGNQLTLLPAPFADADAVADAYNGYFYNSLADDFNGNPYDDDGDGFSASGHGLVGYPSAWAQTGTNSYIIDLAGVVRMRDFAAQSAPGDVTAFPAANDANWTTP